MKIFHDSHVTEVFAMLARTFLVCFRGIN